MRKLLLILILISLAVGSADGQIFKRNASKKAERGLFGKSLNRKKEVKVKQPRAALSAQKKQEAKKKKDDKAYEKAVKRSQQRTLDIQTADVQERMKLNKKETEARDKAKKKNTRSATKRAGKKYR